MAYEHAPEPSTAFDPDLVAGIIWDGPRTGAVRGAMPSPGSGGKGQDAGRERVSDWNLGYSVDRRKLNM